MDIAAALTRALVRQGIPVVGVSIGSYEDRATWRIEYGGGVTDAQRSKADALKMTYTIEGDTALRDEEATSRTGEKAFLALALWCAQRFNVPPATARAEILAIYKSL